MNVQSVWSAVLNPDRVSCQESACAQLTFWPTGELFETIEPAVNQLIDLDGTEICSGMTRASSGVIQSLSCRAQSVTVCEFDCEDKQDWGKLCARKWRCYQEFSVSESSEEISNGSSTKDQRAQSWLRRKWSPNKVVIHLCLSN